MSDYGIQDGRAFNLGVFPGQPERERELCLELAAHSAFLL